MAMMSTNSSTLVGTWIDAASEKPPRQECFGEFWHSTPVLVTDGKQQWVGYWQSWEDGERLSSWKMAGPDGYQITGVTHWMPLPLSPSAAPCSTADNSFTSVLWRRMSTDMRLHDGWTLEDCERNFRKIVGQTLADSPPNPEAHGRSGSDVPCISLLDAAKAAYIEGWLAGRSSDPEGLTDTERISTAADDWLFSDAKRQASNARNQGQE